MKQPETHFLKQYTCLQLTHHLSNAAQPSRTVKLISKGNSSYINSNLRNQILDSFSGTDKLYILKWQFKNSNATTLDIYLHSSEIFSRIQMDNKPSFITIIDKFIYIIIGSELLIIRYENLALEKSYPLGSDIIHAVQPAFSSTLYHELGVEIYTWHQKKGYRKGFYSSFQGTQQKWWSNIKTILFQYASLDLKNSTLKVLIPNVLGVIIMQNLSSLVLINLNSMQIMQQFTTKLTRWSIANPKKCIMKHYISRREQGYDDNLIISIGQKDRQFIELFAFQMKYLPSIIKSQDEVSIKSIQTGEIVDWNNSTFKRLLTISTEGSLIDYLLVEKGLIYYSNTKSRIPVAGFSSYSDPLNTHPILSLEHNICSSYLSDYDLYSMIQEYQKEKEESATDEKSISQIEQELRNLQDKLVNSIFKPNRYSKDLILQSTQVGSVKFLNFFAAEPKKLLTDWYKNYKVKGIYTLNRDIVIVRENSITSLLPITQEQFRSEYQKPDLFFEVMNKISEGGSIKSIYSFELSVNSSKYSLSKPMAGDRELYQNWWLEMNQFESDAYSYQREGISTNNQKTSQYEQIFQKYFKKLMQKIQSDANPTLDTSPEEQNSISSKSILFSRQAILNRVKDLILFYSKILKFTYAKSSQRSSTATSSQNGKKEKNIVNYLSMLESILNNAWWQNCGLNDDLIGRYIEERIDIKFLSIKQEYQRLKQSSQTLQDETSNSNKLTIEQNVDIIIDVQKQSWKIIKSIFFDIISEQNDPESSVNPFIKSLINTYVKERFQYIETFLSATFNPYQTTFPLPYNQGQIQLFGMVPEPYLSWQKQESSFPLTPTLLTIYSHLKIPEEVRNIIFTSFISKYASNERQEKSLNKILNSLPISQSIKQKIGEIYSERNGFRHQQDLSKTTSKTLIKDEKIEQVSSKQQIDYSRGIIYLTKVLQPEAIQNYLMEIQQKELEPIFRANIENILEENLHKGNRGNKPTGRGQTYTISDYLTSWIIKFRVYVMKFKETIQLIDQFSRDMSYSSKDFSSVKNLVIKYVENCIKSLENVIKYYQNLYNIKGVREKLQRNCVTLGNMNEHDTDEQIVQKVCCKMLGYDNADQLYLYEEKPKQIKYQEQDKNKDKKEEDKKEEDKGEKRYKGYKSQRILPTRQFFALILTLLNDQETKVEIIKDQNSIVFYFLKRILENPRQNIQYFKTINKYFCRRWLRNLIEQSEVLKELFIRLPQNQQIKGYFGYMDLSMFDRTSNQQISKIMERQSSKGLKNFLKESQSMNKHKNLPFRNAYLEAVGQ